MSSTKHDKAAEESEKERRPKHEKPQADIPSAPVRVPESPENLKQRAEWFRRRTRKD